MVVVHLKLSEMAINFPKITSPYCPYKRTGRNVFLLVNKWLPNCKKNDTYCNGRTYLKYYKNGDRTNQMILVNDLI